MPPSVSTKRRPRIRKTGKITIRAGKRRKKWTEAELLRGVTPDMVGGEIDWGDPVGKEISSEHKPPLRLRYIATEFASGFDPLPGNPFNGH